MIRNLNNAKYPWLVVKNFIAQKREEKKALKLSLEEKRDLIELLREHCHIDVNIDQKLGLTWMEALVFITRFIDEKYKFRANFLGMSANTLKTHENRVREKLQLDSISSVKYWLIENDVIRVRKLAKNDSVYPQEKIQ